MNNKWAVTKYYYFLLHLHWASRYWNRIAEQSKFKICKSLLRTSFSSFHPFISWVCVYSLHSVGIYRFQFSIFVVQFHSFVKFGFNFSYFFVFVLVKLVSVYFWFVVILRNRCAWKTKNHVLNWFIVCFQFNRTTELNSVLKLYNLYVKWYFWFEIHITTVCMFILKSCKIKYHFV